MKHLRYWGVAAYVVALALNGCSGMPPHAASPDIEPPPWNSLEMMMMNTELVSIDPGQPPVADEPAPNLRIAETRPAS